MRLRSTITLLILNLLAFAYLFYLGREASGSSSNSGREVGFLPQVDGIDEIDVVFSSEVPDNGSAQDPVVQTRRFRRVRQGWELLEPFEWRANEAAVGNLLGLMRNLSAEAWIPVRELEAAGQSLADFGLEHPGVVLSYRVGGALSVELQMGSATALGNRVYLMSPELTEDAITVVRRDLLEALGRPLETFVDRRIIELDFFEVDSLSISSSEKPPVLLQEIGGQWRFETPVTAAASKPLVEAVLGRLIALRAANFFPVDGISPEDSGLDRPSMRLTLGGETRQRTLEIGRELEGGSESERFVYGRLSGTQVPSTPFVVEGSTFELLDEALGSLRERRFFRFDGKLVDTIEIRQGTKTVTLQQLEKRVETAPDEWQVLERGARGDVETWQADLETVSATLEKLSDLEALAFVSDAPSRANEVSWGLSEPTTTVRVRGSSGLDMALLLGGLSSEPGMPMVYAKIDNAPFVYGVGAGALSAFPASALEYRDRQLVTLPDGSIVNSVRVFDVGDSSLVLSMQRQGAGEPWVLEPGEFDADEEKAAAVLGEELAHLRARVFLTSSFGEPPNLKWAYRLVFTATAGGDNGAERERELFLTERIGGTRQAAGMRDPAGTFFIEQPVIDALTPLLFERRLPVMPDTPDEVLNRGSEPES